MKNIQFLLIASLLLFIFACSRVKNVAGPDAVKLHLPETAFSYDRTNSPSGLKLVPYENGKIIDNNIATVGRVLFYDKGLSINNRVSCASCHLQNRAFADKGALSKGFNDEKTVRNSMGICNLTDEKNVGFFWDARETKIEDMVFAPIANHIEMGFDKIEFITEKVSSLPYYKSLFTKAFGDAQVTEARMKQALGQFLFSIVSSNSKFDYGAATNFSNFTAAEMRGTNIFTNTGCATCHFISSSLPGSYNSIRFANIGLDDKDNDKGINGSFKIPRLKNISKTGPYMHDGRFKTLEEVIDHYSTKIHNNPNLTSLLRVSTGPKQFNFSEQEKADLIAFLKTLDDEVMCSDPKFSSPFAN